MLISSLKAGIVQALQNKRMAILFYGLNLIAGLAVAVPLRSALLDVAGSSLAGQRLRDGLDLEFILEFLIKHGASLSMLWGSIVLVAIVYGLGTLLLAGGCLTMLNRSEPFSAGAFWAGAGTSFGRFFRLFLWSLPLFAVLYALQYLENAAVRILYGNDPYETVAYNGGRIRIAIGYVGILCYSMAVDYARIHTILTGEVRMRSSLWKGIRFAFGNFGRTFGIVLILAVAGLLLFAIYNPVAGLFDAPAAGIVFLLILLQQVTLFLRMMVKINLYSSELHLYRSIAGTPSVPAPEC